MFEPRVGGHVYDRAVDGSEHRRLERHGEGWEEYRDGLQGTGGWPVFIERFRGLTVA